MRVCYAHFGVSRGYPMQGNGAVRRVPGVERSFCSRNMSYDSTSIPNRKAQLRKLRTVAGGRGTDARVDADEHADEIGGERVGEVVGQVGVFGRWGVG